MNKEQFWAKKDVQPKVSSAEAVEISGGSSEGKDLVTPATRPYRIGRPRRLQDPQELLDKAAEYIESIMDKNGELIRPLTITGMCNYLGTYRSAFLDYEHGDCSRLKAGQGDDDGFRNAVKQIKAVCEEYAENHMFTARNPAGAIFALKNYGWKDTQTIETTTTEIHTVDPETRELISGYMRQLVASQKGQTIDITPARLPEPVKVQSGGDLTAGTAETVDNSTDNGADKC